MGYGEWFRCGERAFGAQEVLSAADFRGELAPVRADIRDSLACAAFAEEQGYALDEAVLQALSEQYRTAHGLESADATAQWLQARGVDLDDFGEYLERALWRHRFGDSLDAIRGDYAAPEDDVAPLVWPEVVFADAAHDLARWLARRAALWVELGGAPVLDDEAVEAERKRFIERHDGVVDAVEAWCARNKCTAPWFEELARLEAAYRQKRRALLTPENFDREMLLRRQDLMCVEVETAAFPTAAVAQEAYLCVAEDGEPLADVSARAARTAYHAAVFLEGLSEDLQRRLLSASPGETFPPVADGEEYWVYHVCRKMEPDTGDAEVRRRLEHALITKYFDQLVDKHVDWCSQAG